METYKRHDRSDIAIHWFNAACWLLLFVTGVGLLDNPRLNPLGAWYPALLRGLFGGGGNLLAVHVALGFIWIAGFAAYLLVNRAGARAFLAETFRVSPERDLPWMFKKMVLMTLGEKGLAPFKVSPELPPQGFYNMGQKAFGQASVLGGVVLAVTGVVMFLSDKLFSAQLTWLVSWSVTVHYLAAGLVFAGLLVHVYMAAISPEERPGFRSMFTGVVPVTYAKHHHRLWYETVSTETAGANVDTREERQH
ncbi:MAG: formate dehydrogenase subunit gamma [Desulfovibrio aminophilus]|jgi:formate dehydrogenase subunit gamma|uniref:formate dehydrogenase subunit gamma n=1 Tax=Desulfovibrio aminophilus TaxID=81425 RepID=UPI0003F5A3DA|nr:cytochrome b/b6 domain-containing protein [Desulfovibrio aminophilus]